jgi:hypothetical protein
MSSPSRPQDLPLASADAGIEERFRRLASEWKEQSRYLSNTAQIAMLKLYQRIIGLGLPVVLLILEELDREPNHCGSGRSKRSPSRIRCRPKRRVKYV